MAQDSSRQHKSTGKRSVERLTELIRMPCDAFTLFKIILCHHQDFVFFTFSVVFLLLISGAIMFLMFGTPACVTDKLQGLLRLVRGVMLAVEVQGADRILHCYH